MTERIQEKLKCLKDGEYKKQRRDIDKPYITFPEGTDEIYVHQYLLRYMLESERPVLLADDIFGFNRSIKSPPEGICGDKKFDKGAIGNITPDYEYVLSAGMDTIAQRIKDQLSLCKDKEKTELYLAMLDGVEQSLALADRYREYAKEQGANKLYEALCTVPHHPARSFHEACVFLKFIQFTLRCNRNAHITLGGFDKYMLPYFEADMARGVSEDALFETLEDFFITLNLDSDTYFGVQKGDNGMSLVLGGRDMDGNDRYNKLSEMCMLASGELGLIDPKINLRVDKGTPIERLEFATELTKKGLGFPQYCNDDVVIPALIQFGYAPKDAYDYTVAACWEFIVPGNAFDTPNCGAANFPHAISRAVNDHLCDCQSFDEFLSKAKLCIEEECEATAKRITNKPLSVSPYLSVFVDACIERGLDLSKGGAIYNNDGAHGVGIAPAADAIAAVKKAVFDEKRCTAHELVSALNDNFEGHSALRNYLVACPKMGNNDDSVDQYAEFIMNIFADVFTRYKTPYGGIYRPGTGSAMEYIGKAALVGATADGRYAKTPFGSSFSPSPIARLEGPLSCIQSFTKHDLTRVMNGGPLTMEIHDNVFRNDDGVKKVAALVKTFIDLGGHQLQLNSINREILLDAQKHPENHRNLIVRVWGWSGYFVDLDIDYQNQIISRTEFIT